MSISFSELNLSAAIQNSVKNMGFVQASPIQEMAIPFIMQGCDIIGQAQTGTGKTAAFSIPILERLDPGVKDIKALVLCPTRELAVQVADEMGKLAAHQPSLRILPVYGGQSIELQLRALKKRPQIIVGTPGRVMDHMERRTIDLSQVEMVVLDEADEMLNMGFRDDMETILQATPADSQRLLFSATMPSDIMQLAKKYLKQPQVVKTEFKGMTVAAIDQIYYEVDNSRKPESLSRLLDFENFEKVLVFCATRQGVDEITSYLQARDFKADCLHGSLVQSQRDRVMGRFRSGEVKILVATDVAARGLDINDVDAVINFDMPYDAENYVHRIGRTGRAGRSGRSFTFVTGRDYFRLRQIMRQTKAEIKPADLPSLRQVITLKATRLLAQAESIMQNENLEELMKLLPAHLDSDSKLSAALVRMMLKSDFAALKAQKQEKPAKNRRASFAAGNGEKVRLHFNVGRKVRVAPGDLVGAIAGETGHSPGLIGAISIHDSFSLVDIDASIATEVMNIMNKCQIRGARVRVKVDDQNNEKPLMLKGAKQKPGRSNSKERFKPKKRLAAR